MIKNVKDIKTIRKIFILFIAFCIFSEFIFPNLFSKFYLSEASARSKDRSKPVEIISNRDIYSKHYLNSDGTITAIINSAPVHYKNTFGEYEDIDLTITSAGNDKAQKSNTKNNFKIYFEDKNDSKNTTYACMEITNRNGDARWISYKLAGAKSSSDDYYKNKFKFSNVFENVDLEYEINTTQLKENIIIDQPINNYEFNFIIEISEGIVCEQVSNNQPGSTQTFGKTEYAYNSRNMLIRVTTFDGGAAENYTQYYNAVSSPTANNPNHVSIITPGGQVLSDAEAANLQSTFTVKPNPSR